MTRPTRAQQSAEIISDALGIEIHIDTSRGAVVILSADGVDVDLGPAQLAMLKSAFRELERACG